MNNEHPGKLLAGAVKGLSSQIADKLDGGEAISAEDGNKMLFDTMQSFNKEMATNGFITSGAFDLILMAIANYSLLERQILEKNGRPVDTPSRKRVIDKAFHLITTGEPLVTSTTVTEGKTDRGGVNPEPLVPKPDIKPSGQKPNKDSIGESEDLPDQRSPSDYPDES
ncbi:MAG: hypothetical protein DRQ40_03470 [Gammaproteobacteria bacterium]|nr:MAG: hypothetical protein DRQ40_03470 [Gammaproteobacteria bacterium]